MIKNNVTTPMKIFFIIFYDFGAKSSMLSLIIFILESDSLSQKTLVNLPFLIFIVFLEDYNECTKFEDVPLHNL